MHGLEQLVAQAKHVVDHFGISLGEHVIPLKVIALLGTGVFLTLRLRFVQFTKIVHGFAVTSGRYDDPNEPGDVSHFQALTTALSATVGIGNIAGAAWAIHYGGPGALFWMWVTAVLGMATKYTEVTLAQMFRDTSLPGERWQGTVSGGPMYYIERGLGHRWKWMAVFLAIALGSVAFITGNAVQANTLADTMQTQFGIANWVTGAVAAAIIAAVVIGGIRRIGRVTGVLAPLMAAVYVSGALLVIVLHADQVIPALALIVREAFTPSAGVAGTGVGAILVTLNWGVDRGLFSNEAGQGSAPIAHAAAKTDEPVSEGVVGLVEPFIDTIVIVTMTSLVIIITGVWSTRVPSELTLDGGDITYVQHGAEGRFDEVNAPAQIDVAGGVQVSPVLFAWHDVPVDTFYVDREQTQTFTGQIEPGVRVARSVDGAEYRQLYGTAPEGGAPLTMLGFRLGLSAVGDWGHYVVVLSVLLFAISTAISWSYYGDRCAMYLFGPKAVLPYKFVYAGMHLLGTLIAPALAWDLGDILLGIVILPNLIALVLLSGRVRQETKSYFARRPWLDNLAQRRRDAGAAT